jgi:uncharacterized phage protein (TIGR02218 family)
MRPISAAAQAYLASSAGAFPADLFTLTLIGGSPVYRWTSTDIQISYGGFTWLAQSPNLSRSALSVRNTVEVPELKVTLSAFDTDFVGGSNIKQQIHEGALDGARLKLERLPMPAPGDTSLGPPTLMFDGRVGQVQLTSTGAVLQVKGDIVIMNQYAPRNIFQTSCQWTFCDAGCTLSEASFTFGYTVGGATPTISFVPWSGPPGFPAAYVFGKITMTSGINSGQVRMIRNADSSGITVSYPFFNVCAAGDTFQALEGCDKSLNAAGSIQSCQSYSNTAHFRGFPYVPPPQFSV